MGVGEEGTAGGGVVGASDGAVEDLLFLPPSPEEFATLVKVSMPLLLVAGIHVCFTLRGIGKLSVAPPFPVPPVFWSLGLPLSVCLPRFLLSRTHAHPPRL